MTTQTGTKREGLRNLYAEASENKQGHGFVGIIFGKAAAMLDALGLRFSSAASGYAVAEEEKKKKADFELLFELS